MARIPPAALGWTTRAREPRAELARCSPGMLSSPNVSRICESAFRPSLSEDAEVEQKGRWAAAERGGGLR